MKKRKNNRNENSNNFKNNKDMLVHIINKVDVLDDKMNGFDYNVKEIKTEIIEVKQKQDISSEKLERLNILIIGDVSSTDEKKQLGIIGRLREQETWRNNLDNKIKSIGNKLWVALIAVGGWLVQGIIFLINVIVKYFNNK